ncbi:hypothetical protein ACFFRR_003572 [Megaselia abdita]
MSFKSARDKPEKTFFDSEKTVHKIINNFHRNDSSDECPSRPWKIIPQKKNTAKPLKILSVLNNIYRERIRRTKDIVRDPDLIITIYEEWNENLKKYCLNLIEMMEELKKDAYMHLDVLGEKLNSSMFEISKQDAVKDDLANLIELIKRTFNDNRGWDVNGLKFQTITLTDIFGEDFETDISESESKKLERTEESDQKKMADILKDNDLLKSEISYLKRQIKRDLDSKK